jgi:hypothetical protein
VKVEDGFEISIYSGELPTEIQLNQAVGKLIVAFPKMSKEFFILLSEYLIKENFTSERLRDAVDKVICNFQYKELNISDVIAFDKRIKLYTWNDVYKLAGKFPSPDFKLYDKERRLYAKITDL